MNSYASLIYTIHTASRGVEGPGLSCNQISSSPRDGLLGAGTTTHLHFYYLALLQITTRRSPFSVTHALVPHLSLSPQHVIVLPYDSQRHSLPDTCCSFWACFYLLCRSVHWGFTSVGVLGLDRPRRALFIVFLKDPPPRPACPASLSTRSAGGAHASVKR